MDNMKANNKHDSAWHGPIKKERRFKTGNVDVSHIKSMIFTLGQADPVEQKKAYRALQIQRTWEKIAPPEVLAHTDNVFLLKKNDVKQMIVYVDSSLWAAELNAQKLKFKIKMENELGEGPIDEIKFMPSSITYKKKEFRKQSELPPSYIDNVKTVLLTEEERLKIHQEAAVVENVRLREALINARIKDLEWKKGIEAAKRR